MKSVCKKCSKKPKAPGYIHKVWGVCNICIADALKYARLSYETKYISRTTKGGV